MEIRKPCSFTVGEDVNYGIKETSCTPEERNHQVDVWKWSRKSYSCTPEERNHQVDIWKWSRKKLFVKFNHIWGFLTFLMEQKTVNLQNAVKKLLSLTRGIP